MDIFWIIDDMKVIAAHAGSLITGGHCVDVLTGIGYLIGAETVKEWFQVSKPDVVILHADSVRFGDDRCIIALAKELGVKTIVYGFDKTLAQVADGSLPWPIYSFEELLAEIERVTQKETSVEKSK